MLNLIYKIKKIYNKYKIKNNIKDKIKILYNKNNKYGDITIILSNNIYNYDIIDNLLSKINKYILNYEIKKNYLNIYLNNYYYIKIINKFLIYKYNIYKIYNIKKNNKIIIIDYSSPNSNKPLHIGHLRNILIGNTLSNIFKYLGFKVIKSQIINDRGIHICKSIISWKLYYNCLKPNLNKIKGDHFVGKLYFKFEKELKKEINIISKKYKIDKIRAKKKSKLLKKVKNELIKWENNNKKSILLWKKINSWVYKGFKKTYKKLNIKFNETLYESKTYILGKNKIKEGIKNKIFLIDKNKYIYYLLNKKYKIILLRSDGTSLYITQEIGTLLYRLKKYKKIYLLIYVVGNEQSFHFKVLFNIIKILKLPIKNKNIHHLSYNTVNILGKKIKSREGKNIIFIDNLITIMYKYVKNKFSNIKNKKILKNISISTIKYQFLKIKYNKIINFNFKNILNLTGNTSLYIHYTYVRIYSIFKKNKNNKIFLIKKKYIYKYLIKRNEKDIIIDIIKYHEILKKSAKDFDTSILINYIFLLSKKINNFYNKNKVLSNNKYKKNIRLNICKIILNILYNTMKILNIPIINKI
ncbi:arginine--tRNA ligase [Candidatus Shikimatogenerans bostrichidophilus]|uniref:arginine--tRNA ligase n=1 Tax=Candidatus Shikimatogenerans bostrichidophilus TaxID=2943807 RepID=UPI00296667AF